MEIEIDKLDHSHPSTSSDAHPNCKNCKVVCARCSPVNSKNSCAFGDVEEGGREAEIRWRLFHDDARSPWVWKVRVFYRQEICGVHCRVLIEMESGQAGNRELYTW